MVCILCNLEKEKLCAKQMCSKCYHKQWAKNNPEKVKLKAKKNYNKNKEKINLKHKEWISNNNDHIKQYDKEYYHKNKNTKLKFLNRKDYYQKNKSIINQKKKFKFHNNINFKLSELLRNRIRASIKNQNKSASTIELLGCSIDELKQHLEKHFKDGMTWDNYGYYGWHVDHIIPCANFDLSDSKQQKICFHYTNLQPLWWQDNFKKGNKII